MWVNVEYANEFPFCPLMKKFTSPVFSDYKFTSDEDLFIAIVERIFGNDPKGQVYFFSSYHCLVWQVWNMWALVLLKLADQLLV